MEWSTATPGRHGKSSLRETRRHQTQAPPSDLVQCRESNRSDPPSDDAVPGRGFAPGVRTARVGARCAAASNRARQSRFAEQSPPNACCSAPGNRVGSSTSWYITLPTLHGRSVDGGRAWRTICCSRSFIKIPRVAAETHRGRVDGHQTRILKGIGALPCDLCAIGQGICFGAICHPAVHHACGGQKNLYDTNHN